MIKNVFYGVILDILILHKQDHPGRIKKKLIEELLEILIVKELNFL